MKNIKNILMVLSLLTASVAFGCPQHEGYMDGDMDDEMTMTERM